MSEFQYYEFRAIDKPLSDQDRNVLRKISSRAEITSTSFTNTYNFGDFKGNPRKLVERFFDVHLYYANWGTWQLLIRLPRKLIDKSQFIAFFRNTELVRVYESSDYIIIDINKYEEEYYSHDYDGDQDISDVLAAMLPLRDDVLSGDFRLFYLIWLLGVQEEEIEDDEFEPLPRIGPLTAAHIAFCKFFQIDPDLVQAAGKNNNCYSDGQWSTEAVFKAVDNITPTDKTKFLQRLVEGDSHVAFEVRNIVRQSIAANRSQGRCRTVAELRNQATTIQAENQAAEDERQRRKYQLELKEAEEKREARLVYVRRRGEYAWEEVEREINNSGAVAYQRAVDLLCDLQTLAQRDNAMDQFSARISSIRNRHSRKKMFLDMLSNSIS